MDGAKFSEGRGLIEEVKSDGNLPCVLCVNMHVVMYYMQASRFESTVTTYIIACEWYYLF